jgi:T4-like virus tail tube protein gp19
MPQFPVNPVDVRSGGDTSADRRSPGTRTWPPIVLERGKTQDMAFEEWANLVWNESAPISPSEYTALSDLDAEANEVAIETLVLEHEGWERDTEVQEPVET